MKTLKLIGAFVVGGFVVLGILLLRLVYDFPYWVWRKLKEATAE